MRPNFRYVAFSDITKVWLYEVKVHFLRFVAIEISICVCSLDQPAHGPHTRLPRAPFGAPEETLLRPSGTFSPSFEGQIILVGSVTVSFARQESTVNMR